jgi:cytochrome P450
MTEAPVMPWYLRRQGEFDPDPGSVRVREEEGITRVTTPFGIEAWLVTRVEDVRELLADSRRFSNDIPPERLRGVVDNEMSDEEMARARAGNLLSFDPPEHTRLRRVLTPAFTVRQMRRLESRIREIVEDHLDAMERSGAPADLVQAFALPIPSLVICELLGVPYQDRAGFQRRSNRLLDLSLPPEERLTVFRESRAYMETLVDGALADPGPEMLGSLVREHGDELSRDELVGIGNLLLIAGHETTANMLGLGTLALLRHPDQLRLVRDHPEHVEAAVEELLRWLSIVTSALTRMTTQPVEIAGQRIEAGELVMAALPTANRDPALVTDPDVLDVTRGAIGHVAFGHGVHHCLGAPLARAEMRTAFPALLRRFPGLRLADPGDPVELRSSSFIYGVARLPVAW